MDADESQYLNCCLLAAQAVLCERLRCLESILSVCYHPFSCHSLCELDKEICAELPSYFVVTSQASFQKNTFGIPKTASITLPGDLCAFVLTVVKTQRFALHAEYVVRVTNTESD